MIRIFKSGAGQCQTFSDLGDFLEMEKARYNIIIRKRRFFYDSDIMEQRLMILPLLSFPEWIIKPAFCWIGN